MPDFTYTNHGSIGVLAAWTDAGKEWILDHINSDATGWGSNGVVVEPRYINDIINGIEADGLTIEN